MEEGFECIPSLIPPNVPWAPPQSLSSDLDMARLSKTAWKYV